MIHLHAGQPLFFPFKEMSEYNAILRRELIMALLLALDLLRQNGVSVEQTAQAEKIRREYIHLRDEGRSKHNATTDQRISGDVARADS